MGRRNNHQFVPPTSQFASYERLVLARRELRMIQTLQLAYTAEYRINRDMTLLPNRSRLRERAAWLAIEVEHIKAWYDALPYQHELVAAVEGMNSSGLQHQEGIK